ncbi:MAG: hypothetical protein LBR26_00935 [Prevotella sp.]|jgi:hypothetical protein|nr:hypothetical protein [Prevotella sp.]
MKKYHLFILTVLSILFFSCEDKVTKIDVWPEWPSLPMIESAQLCGLNGETTVAAGDRVKFTARVSDSYNDLASYQLEFKSGGVIIASKTGTLSGAGADIEFETTLPFGAYYEDAGYPEVNLKVINVLNIQAERTLNNENNVRVTRPETPVQLYIVDNEGGVYTLNRIGNTYEFLTSGSLAEIGTSFKIASKLIGNSQIDYSELVWGVVDGNIVVVHDASDASIPTPKTDSYGLKNLSFDMYSFILSKTVDFLIEINKSDMAPATKGGIAYLSKENIPMVQDCEVRFTGFGQDLTTMLRPDLFVSISGDVAKFAGNTRNWRAFYNTENGFMYVQTYNNEENLLWLTGQGAGFPLPPYVSTFDWFGTEPHGYFSFIRTGEDTFEMLIYLASDFYIQAYRKVAWGEVLNPWASVTPSLLTVNSNNDGVPGPDFKPGVYTIRIDAAKREGALIPYN